MKEGLDTHERRKAIQIQGDVIVSDMIEVRCRLAVSINIYFHFI